MMNMTNIIIPELPPVLEYYYCYDEGLFIYVFSFISYGVVLLELEPGSRSLSFEFVSLLTTSSSRSRSLAGAVVLPSISP